MLVRCTAFFTLLLLSLPVWSSYDTEALKKIITEQQALFQVTGWQTDAQQQSWTAITTLKWVTITLNTQGTEITSPYINATQVKAARERCLAIASPALQLTTDEQRTTLQALMKKATQHHAVHSMVLNRVKFEVVPKLVGSFVRLFCSVKPTAGNT
ncbi:MAG: hypothetical protein FD130_704 [Halothiobacillaceae bacterium]|nr:MAG: hypothetical protein FD130_704 [Halothiobacillaceae bacterium]